MPRFSAFTKRKSNADETENADVTGTPPASSFRVLERHEVAPVPGAARMPRGSAAPPASRPDFDDDDDDNLFSGLKPHNRGSGISNTTHATYTDNSSRHSNASTAPSSADCKTAHDEGRLGSSSKQNPPENTGKGGSSGKSIGSKFLGRAGRTFSLGQKKNSSSHSKDEPTPDMPPLLSHSQAPQERLRGMNLSSTHPANLQADQIDLGTDFGSMIPSFDKRASMATVKLDDHSSPRMLTAGRPVQPGKRIPPSPDTPNPADPLLSPWGTPKDGADQSRPDSPLFELPPPVPPHLKSSPGRAHPQAQSQAQSQARRGGRPAEEPRLTEEDFAALPRLPGASDYTSPSQSRRLGNDDDDDDEEEDDNLFEGRPSQFAKALNRAAAPKGPAPPEKVMTSNEFEKYARKVREAGEDDDSEDEINYSDDEDELDKAKEIAKQRRKQEATMAVYRQQMMKVTGTPASEMPQPDRPGLPSSVSAPQLSQMKGPQQPLPTGASDGDEDEEIPLAILQAHGFPNKNRPPTRLNNMASNPNIRASMASSGMARPTSMVSDAGGTRRHSTLPAFARNLPQDPYYGASIARPALRESMLFNDFSHVSQMHKPPSPRPVAGLIGIIDREEKAKALRRGSPSVDATRFMGSGGYLGVNNQGMDSMGGIQQHMMYNHPLLGGGGMQGMAPPHLQQQQQQLMMPMGDQAQFQMGHQQMGHQQMGHQQMGHQQMGHQQMGHPQMNQQQLSQYMQMQTQHNMGMGGQGNMMPPQHFGRIQGSSSMMNLATPRGNFEGGAAAEARRADYNMRTMSMVQTSSAPMVHPGYAGSIRSSMHGYAPSVAPSERSNVGLPNRYRAVSQAAGAGGQVRPTERARSAMRVVNKPASIDDEDDEQGWEAMKAKREKRMSMWKSKKGASPAA